MQTLFSELDDRIFHYSFANLFNLGYLFNTQPKEFSYRSWLLAFVLLTLVISAVLYYLKRRKLIDPRRRSITFRFAKYNAIGAVVMLVYIIMRQGQVTYLSMRIIGLAIIIAMLANAGYYIYLWFKVGSTMPEAIPEIKTSTTDYQKYLPRRKRK